MQLYQSDYITIRKRGSLLIQEWSGLPMTSEIFKSELISYLQYFVASNPKTILWLNENFNFTIPDDVALWMEHDLLNSDYVNGMRKIAIMVANDRNAHLALVKVLNTSKTLMQPHYFTDRKLAETYLNSGYDPEDYNLDSIQYTIDTNTENHQINLQVSHNDLPQAIDALESLKNNKNFAKTHEKKFKRLTTKELEIFKLIVQGNSNKEIAKLLFIQTSTVATHRKHIVKKLETYSFVELYKYAKAFKVVRF